MLTAAVPMLSQAVPAVCRKIMQAVHRRALAATRIAGAWPKAYISTTLSQSRRCLVLAVEATADFEAANYHATTSAPELCEVLTDGR